MSRVSWPAVAALILALCSWVAAALAQDWTTAAIAAGASSTTAAVLALRDRH